MDKKLISEVMGVDVSAMAEVVHELDGGIDRITLSGGVDVIWVYSEKSRAVIFSDSEKSPVSLKLENGVLKIKGKSSSIVIRNGVIHVGDGVSVGGISNQPARIGMSQVAGRNIVNQCVTTVRGCLVGIRNVIGDAAYVAPESYGVIVVVESPVAPNIKIKGSGDMYYTNLEQSSLDIKVKGSGDVFATGGKLTTVDVLIRGSGDVHLGNVKVDNCSVSVQGSGDVDVNVSKVADVSIRGSGDITVYGKPKKKQQQVLGTGSVQWV